MFGYDTVHRYNNQPKKNHVYPIHTPSTTSVDDYL